MSAVTRIFAAVLAAVSLVMLSGCTVLEDKATGVEELLRAPQLPGQYSQVQKALNSYLGESAQLKYPATGDFCSPFLFGDWNGDGVQDATVLYTTPAKGQNVHLAILEQDAQEGWKVTQEVEGLSSSVDSIFSAGLQGGAGNQLIVGYGSTQGDKYLAVYSYADQTLDVVYQQAYAQYLVQDITGNHFQDIVIVSPSTESSFAIQLLTNQDGQYRLVQEMGVGQQSFTGCAGIYSSVGSDGGRYLILDGITGETGTALASSILHYNSERQQLEPFLCRSTPDLFTATRRYFPILHSMDIDQDGTVEIPTVLSEEEGGSVSFTQDRRLCFVSWKDYTNEEQQEVSYGVLDVEYGYYLELPWEWKGNVMLTENEAQQAWEVRNREDETLYLSVRSGQQGRIPAGYSRIAALGGVQVQAKIDPAAKPLLSERNLIHGFRVL